jgi:hypothetical protein
MILYRVDDVLPQLGILVKDGNTIQDLTTLDVHVRWQKPDGTEIAERQAVVAPDPTTGIANYVWIAGDLDQAGTYKALIQLSPEGNPTARYSLTNPPLIEIEVLSNDFVPSDTSLLLPYPSSSQVAALLNMDLADMDGNILTMSIERGRTLAYAYAELWRCPGLVLDPIGERIAKELIAELAAMSYVTNPLVMYGPYKKETFGSYSYEMKDGNLLGTRQQTGGKTGLPALDAMVNYLAWLCGGCEAPGVDLLYPDWTQPVTYRVEDPSLPIQ